MFFSAILAAGGLAALSSAHVVITEPVPFSVPALHNGPLAPDGSDFPCQSTDGVYSGTPSVMTLGSKQPLNFMGSAVHGGGSCQVSITYDNPPTKNSVWKVIHSIEGGCPARDTSGNLGNDANLKVPFDYSYPIPADIPAGNGTIAWTWLNKVGNREFYMNCAPVTLTGAGGDRSNWEALPDMLVANIGNGCTTQEGKDYKYPDPGNSVQSFAQGELAFPVGNCGATSRPPAGGSGSGAPSGPGAGAPGAGAPGSGAPGAGAPGAGSPGSGAPGAGSGAPGAGAPGAGAPGAGAPTAAPPSPTKAPSLPGGVFITVSESAAPAPTGGAGPSDDVDPTPSPEPEPEAPQAPQTPTTPVVPETPATPPSTGSGSGAFAAGTACSTEGEWNCIGGTSFQRCASGTWSTVMAVAGGTSCTPGQSSTLQFGSASKKRRVALPFRG